MSWSWSRPHACTRAHPRAGTSDGDACFHHPGRAAYVKIKQPSRKRKRIANEKGEKKAKKIRLRVRVKTQVELSCCFCPNSTLESDLLPTDDGRKAHRKCALYGPETWVETVDGKIVANATNISKACLDLKCLYCRSQRGACFQCPHRKCTCAMVNAIKSGPLSPCYS
jgi:hypothetical protein